MPYLFREWILTHIYFLLEYVLFKAQQSTHELSNFRMCEKYTFLRSKLKRAKIHFKRFGPPIKQRTPFTSLDIGSAN